MRCTHRRGSLCGPFSASVVLAVAFLTAPSRAQLDWRRVATVGPPQSFAGYAHDPVRDRLVLFGGLRGATTFDTTWEWDGNAWQQRAPVLRPSPRSRPAMAYDAARSVVVLFGGRTPAGGFLNDTWLWNGASWQRANPNPAPPIRYGAAMAYDRARQVVVMFGGFVPSGQDANDLWEWNGASWTPRASVGSVPRGRGAHRLAFDRVRGTTVLYGGFSTPLQRTLSDTWTWDGTAWSPVGGAAGNGTRCDQAMDYDAARNRVVLFGGLRINGPSQFELGGTWDWDGAAWVQRAPVGLAPTARTHGHAAYDPNRRQLLMYGGNLGNTTLAETWVLAPVNPASLTAYGAGCAGQFGVPALLAVPDQLPWLGDLFDVQIQNGPPGATQAEVLIGVSDSSWGGFGLPLDLTPFGVAGCQLLTSIELSVSIPLNNGTGTFTGSVCNCSFALGLPFYLQAVVADPGGTRSVPVALTQGLRGVVGGR